LLVELYNISLYGLVKGDKDF